MRPEWRDVIVIVVICLCFTFLCLKTGCLGEGCDRRPEFRVPK